MHYIRFGLGIERCYTYKCYTSLFYRSLSDEELRICYPLLLAGLDGAISYSRLVKIISIWSRKVLIHIYLYLLARKAHIERCYTYKCYTSLFYRSLSDEELRICYPLLLAGLDGAISYSRLVKIISIWYRKLLAPYVGSYILSFLMCCLAHTGWYWTDILFKGKTVHIRCSNAI